MPTITVKVPEPKGADVLQKSLLREFESIRKQLQGLKDDGDDRLLKSLSRQQDLLAKALERLFAKLTKMPHAETGESMAGMMRSMKSAMSDLGDSLKSAMVQAMKQRTTSSTSRPQITVKPEVKVNLNGLGKRLDRMEDALLTNGHRSRNRTFGSNY